MDDSQLELIVADVLSASAFFTAPGVSVRIEARPAETLRWEIFRGHLLDARQTREERTFRSWHIWIDDPEAPRGPLGDDSGAPSVALRWDAAREELNVTRAILIRGWEVYESRPGFLESRPAARWLSELVGTLDFRAPWRRCASPEEQRRELAVVLAQAWTGVSRLPITSIEAPLPSFSLGRSGYDASLDLPATATAERLLSDAWRRPTAPGASLRLEMALRALAGPPNASLFDSSPDDPALRAARSALIERLFHGISLSPFTGFTERVLQLLAAAHEADQLSESQAVDLTSHMIRHLVRHLTAYDLVKFHSFGANYPDALWLDQLLRTLIQHAARSPQLFLDAPEDDAAAVRAKRLRRRGLRQGLLVRRTYEGHRVPDAPTSQGEHLRILPASFETAPEQQITEPGTRRRQLFADSPSRSLIPAAAEAVWRASLEDLRDERELRELGAATFLDRPFGIFKPPGAVDRTPLLAYEACSRQIAQQRLADLRRVADGDVSSTLWDDANAVLATLAIAGVPVSDLPGSSRQGVIMLEDARQASPDFAIVRTTRGSLRRLAEVPVLWNSEQRRMLLEWAEELDTGLLLRAGSSEQVRSSGVWLERRSADGRVVGEVRCAASSWGEYGEAWGVEFPRAELVMRRFRSSSLGS
ncbi:MAG: hypothetical protein U0939_11605 [Pirellulales bacterium]